MRPLEIVSQYLHRKTHFSATSCKSRNRMLKMLHYRNRHRIDGYLLRAVTYHGFH